MMGHLVPPHGGMEHMDFNDPAIQAQPREGGIIYYLSFKGPMKSAKSTLL